MQHKNQKTHSYLKFLDVEFIKDRTWFALLTIEWLNYKQQIPNYKQYTITKLQYQNGLVSVI